MLPPASCRAPALSALAPVLLCALLGQAALAQPADAPEPEDPWTLKFEPVAWYVAIEGNVRFPGSAAAGNGETYTAADLNLDSPQISPQGELHLQRGRWRARISSSALDVNDRGVEATTTGQIGAVPFGSGDTLRSSVDLFTLAADGQYRLYRYHSEPGSVPIRSSIFALAGVRAIDLEASTEVLSNGSARGTASGDALHAHPYAGLRWEMDVLEDFTLDLTTSIGGLSTGDNESWSSDILVGFQWNPTASFGAQVGYRQLLFGIETDEAPREFAWQGGIAGVYAGIVVKF